MPLLERPFGPTTQNGTIGGLQPLNSSGAEVVPILPATQTLINTTETVILNPQLSGTPLLIQIPPHTWPLEQTVFDIIASGYATLPTAADTLALKLYSGQSTTVASNTLLGTTGAITVGAATVPWWLHAQVVFDSVSGKLVGKFDACVGNVLTAPVALSNIVTGINNNDPNNTGLPILNFLLSATGSVANALVSVYRFNAG